MTKSIILAGTSRSGKTTLARRLHQETGVSLVSGDALICTFESVYPELNIGHAETWETTCKNWEDFILVYLNHIATYENIPFIFDTFHLSPEQVIRHKLHEKYRVIFLGYPDVSVEEKMHQTRQHKTAHYDWTDERNDTELAEDIDTFIARSIFLQQECAKCGLDFVDTGRDFNAALETAYRIVMS